MGGGHLYAAGTELHVHVLIGHDGHLTAHQGQDALFAHDVLIALVVGVDGHAGIAQHGLRTGGGHDDIAALLALDGIADVPEVAGLVLILHLGVAQSGDAVGAPVDDAAALVDETLLVQAAEDLTHRLGAALVHGEPGAVPVAGDAHLLLLLDDAVAVLVLPVPDTLQELLAAQVVAGQTLLGAQLLFHLDLGGDAGVVHAGYPQGGVALHALEADEDILQGAVHGVAHVQLAGDIGGRHDDGEGFPLRVTVTLEAAVLLPGLIDPGLDFLGLINLWQFFFHGCCNTPLLCAPAGPGGVRLRAKKSP